MEQLTPEQQQIVSAIELLQRKDLQLHVWSDPEEDYAEVVFSIRNKEQFVAVLDGYCNPLGD
jgi:hypothetical protein